MASLKEGLGELVSPITELMPGYQDIDEDLKDKNNPIIETKQTVKDVDGNETTVIKKGTFEKSIVPENEIPIADKQVVNDQYNNAVTYKDQPLIRVDKNIVDIMTPDIETIYGDRDPNANLVNNSSDVGDDPFGFNSYSEYEKRNPQTIESDLAIQREQDDLEIERLRRTSPEAKKNLDLIASNPEAAKAVVSNPNRVKNEYGPMASAMIKLAVRALTGTIQQGYAADYLNYKDAVEFEKERLKNAPKGIEFSKDAKRVNVGTDNNPVLATMTTNPTTGESVYSVNGRLLTAADLKAESQKNPAVYSPTHQQWYSQSDRNKKRSENIDRMNSLLKPKISKFVQDSADSEQKARLIPTLMSQNQMSNAFKVMQENGINTDFGYDDIKQGVILQAALEKAINDNSGTGLDVYVRNEIIRGDMGNAPIVTEKGNAAIPTTAYMVGAYDDSGKFGGGKAPGETPKDAWIKTKRGVENLFNEQRPKDKEASKVNFNKKVGYAWNIFNNWENRNGLQPDNSRQGAALANFIVAHEKGYTPFMWWVSNNKWAK